jgi:hypothetical protein
LLALLFVPAPDLSAQSLDELLVRSGVYVQGLQDRLAVVIADETYVQDVWSRSARRGSGTGRIMSRTIKSEMLFMQLPQADVWLSIRNVLMVDGHPVADSKERLDRALAAPGFDYVSRLRAIDAESARYDIGHVWRTTGYPTLALRFLLPPYRSRFTFAAAGEERVGGEIVSKVRFTERERPTVIQVNDSNVPSAGMIWVRRADGAVVRTSLTLTTPSNMKVSIAVSFGRDPRLDVWVPARMDERYEEISGDSTTCSARYSNYRRFETSGRLIVPHAP